MICFSAHAFALFLTVTGLSVSGEYPVYTVHSDQPRIYVWTGRGFCWGGSKL